MSDDIKALHEKLDALNVQMSVLTTRLKSFDEFKEDMAIFSNDAFSEVIKFLADVDFHYKSGDFLFLIKKFLSNIKNITHLFDQLQSITDLAEDISPLAKEMVNDMIMKLHNLNEDGFFRTIDSLSDFFKKLSITFSEEDIGNMGDTVLELLKLANRISSPEKTENLKQVITLIESGELKKEKKPSLFKTFKKAKQKEVLGNVGYALDILKAMSINE